MLKSTKQIKWFEWLLIAAMTLFMQPAFADGENKAQGTISGQVTDVDGMPLEGVTVSVSQKGVASVMTNPGGVFTLKGVKQKSGILVNFTKDGYALTQSTASLVSKATKAKEADDDGDEDEGGKKLLKATVVKTMLKNGTKQKLDAVTGGVFVQDGFKVTFPANSLTVPAGSIDLTITPIDVSTNQIKGAPGDFSARRANGQRTHARSMSLADFALTQNGTKVNLKAGQTAEIELLLPAGVLANVGDSKPMAYFNSATGLLQEEGTGVVGKSTDPARPDRLAVFAKVKHFTWWYAAQNWIGNFGLYSTLVCGRVVDKNNTPVVGAYVNAYYNAPSPRYFWDSSYTTTGFNGDYCIEAVGGSNDIIYASIVTSSGRAESNSLSFVPDGKPLQDLVINLNQSCISGDIKNANGSPVPNALVYTAIGGFAYSDINGTYNLAAPENSSVKVFTIGFPSVTVTTPVSGGACAVANIRPGSAGGPACLTGVIQICSGPPIPGAIVNAYGMSTGGLLSTSLPTGSDGRYCLPDLPANTFVNIDSFDAGFPKNNILTGDGGGSCAANTCNIGPDIDGPC